MQTAIIVIVAAVLLLGLVYLHKRQTSFTKLVFLALIGGGIYGSILQLIFGSQNEALTSAIEWIGIVGSGYVALLQMLIIPLIFVSIVGAFTKLTVSKNLRKMATTVLITLLGTTAIAALLGIASVLLFHLQGGSFASGLSASSTALSAIREHQSELTGQTLPAQIISFLPTNIFADFAGTRSTSTIAVVIFSFFVGVAYLWVRDNEPESGRVFAKGIDALQKIVSRIVKLVLELTPYGIFALITRTLATNSFSTVTRLGVFIIAAYLAIIVMFGVHTIILLFNGVNPITYYKKAWPALVFAFSSRTSAGTLPLNVKIQEESLGVSSTVANFAASFGLTIGQNGCAGLYPAMVATIIAPTAGINVLSWQFILSLIAIVTIASFGVAGVGGGATFTTLIVLGTLGLPVGILGVLIAIDPIVDMARTALNVNDSILAGVITSKQLDEFDGEVFLDNNKIVSAEL